MMMVPIMVTMMDKFMRQIITDLCGACLSMCE